MHMTKMTTSWVADADLFDRAFREIDTRFPEYFAESPTDDHCAVFLFLVDRFLARTVHYVRKSLQIDYDWMEDYSNGLSPEDACHKFLDQRVEAFFRP